MQFGGTTSPRPFTAATPVRSPPPTEAVQRRVGQRISSNKKLRPANGTFSVSALTTTDGSWYSVTLRSAAGERGSLHLGSTTAPSAAVHEKSCVQATRAPPLIFSMIRPSSSWFLPHGSRTGSCAIFIGLFLVGDK
uniref:Uncharacterized protein n=1 Tax=Triticum urartu TaxID=4572 RepID=A0A8R7K4A6_TRIUA